MLELARFLVTGDAGATKNPEKASGSQVQLQQQCTACGRGGVAKAAPGQEERQQAKFWLTDNMRNGALAPTRRHDRE
jgi:hypothetical protein